MRGVGMEGLGLMAWRGHTVEELEWRGHRESWDRGDTGRVEWREHTRVLPGAHSPLTLLQQAGVRRAAPVRGTELCGAGPRENTARAASGCQSAPTAPPPPSTSLRASAPLSRAACPNTLWDGSGTGQAGSTEL